MGSVDVVVGVAVDDVDTIEMVSLVIFHVLGASASLAADGVEALEQVRQHRPALVLLDVRLGKLSGLTVARRIPMIALVGAEDARLDTVKAGCDDCIIKPLDVDSLAERVRTYLPRQVN